MLTKHKVFKDLISIICKAPFPIYLLLLAGFALRLYRLGLNSLWYDETISAYLAVQPPAELIAHTARDIHPPGYYLLLHFWATVAGQSEFALAFFSLICGVLLIALTYRLAHLLTTSGAATWAAWLVALSPYHLWYSQEVRMYTLGAALGVAATYCALRAIAISPPQNLSKPGGLSRRFWLGYVVCAALGLYTLYYFAFLLIILNLVLLAYTLKSTQTIKENVASGVPLLIANTLVIMTYLPWLPVAWWQITTPPVPPWRSATALGPLLLESWSALSLGQAVDPAAAWPILLLTLALFILGLRYLLAARPYSLLPLVAYIFGPLLLIYLFSFITPLYHVRYVFTYAPAFYIVLGVGLAALTRSSFSSKSVGILRFTQNDIISLTCSGLLLAASLFSIYRYHFDPRYRPDDFRAAVAFITDRWQPGDVILVNAGYTYPAFIYYNNLPSLERRRLTPYQPPADPNHPLLLQTGTLDGPSTLGWGDPHADFYAMPAAEAVSALNSLSSDFYRLWQLRVYDTVTDPGGLIRIWLHENTISIEDESFTGESNIRVQGFLLNKKVALAGEKVNFEDGLTLTGFTLPPGPWQPGQTVYVKLAWLANASPHADYKMSLKLWAETGQLAAQSRDDWPGGTLFRATKWSQGQTVYQPASLSLPTDLPPGRYWLNVELYHPDTIQPLARLDGQSPVVTLGPVEIKN